MDIFIAQTGVRNIAQSLLQRINQKRQALHFPWSILSSGDFARGVNALIVLILRDCICKLSPWLFICAVFILVPS